MFLAEEIKTCYSWFLTILMCVPIFLMIIVSDTQMSLVPLAFLPYILLVNDGGEDLCQPEHILNEHYQEPFH